MQLQGYAACGDDEVREVVRRGYAHLYELVRELSGADPLELQGFFADRDADQRRRGDGPPRAVLRRDVDEGLPGPGRGDRRLGFAAMPSSEPWSSPARRPASGARPPCGSRAPASPSSPACAARRTAPPCAPQDGRIEPVLVDVTDAGQIAGLAAARRRRPAGRAGQQRRHRGRRAAGGHPARPGAPPVRGQRLRPAGRHPGPARPDPRRPGADRQHRLDRRAHQHAVRRALQLLEGRRAQPERVAAARAAPVGHPRRARRARRAGHPDLAQGRGGRQETIAALPDTCAPSTPARSTRWSPPRARSPRAPARPTTPHRPSSTRLPPSARGRSTPSAAGPTIQGALHSRAAGARVRRAGGAGDEDLGSRLAGRGSARRAAPRRCRRLQHIEGKVSFGARDARRCPRECAPWGTRRACFATAFGHARRVRPGLCIHVIHETAHPLPTARRKRRQRSDRTSSRSGVCAFVHEARVFRNSVWRHPRRGPYSRSLCPSFPPPPLFYAGGPAGAPANAHLSLGEPYRPRGRRRRRTDCYERRCLSSRGRRPAARSPPGARSSRW